MHPSKLWALFLFSAGQASAQESSYLAPWNDVAEQCRGWEISGLQEFLPRAKAWDSSNQQAQSRTEKFYKETCPSYLGNANGERSVGHETAAGISREVFVREMQSVFLAATNVKAQAVTNENYLKYQLNDWGAWLAQARLSMNDHPCGARLLERRGYVQREVQKLESNIDKVRTECPQTAEMISAIRSKERSPASVGLGTAAPPTTPRARKQTPSDITGTEGKRK